MDLIKDKGSVNKPPIFYGTNYDYRKAIMVVFLKSVDKAWKVVIGGKGGHPMVTSED